MRVRKATLNHSPVISGGIVAALAFCHVLAAKIVELPMLPEGTLPNSEIVTNIVLDVNADRIESMTFSLGLDASATNSLSIAVGAASGDVLALEEADFEWGYDCGKWFYADTATGSVEEWASAETGRVERAFAISRRDVKPQWNRLRIVKRGLGDIHVEAVQTNEFKKFNIRLR